jgi:hypothetical protein
LGWSSILRDIVLPLQWKFEHVIYVDKRDPQIINDKDIITSSTPPPLPVDCDLLLLNNALYSDKIKTSSLEEVNNNEQNIMLFSLINNALNIKPIKHVEILPGINVILCINLKHRSDRKKRSMDNFIKLGIEPHQIRYIEAIYTPNNGALGCFQSHIKALNIAIQDYDGQNVMICEDDIVLNKNPVDIIDELNMIKNDPVLSLKKDVLMLSHNTQQYKETDNKNILRLIESQTGSAYMANTLYLKKLYDLFTSVFDIYISKNSWIPEFCNDQCWKVLQKNDGWYGPDKAFFIQGQSYSDIENKTVKYNK